LQKQERTLTLAHMIDAAFKALGDLFSAEFRSILVKAVGLSLALFVALFAAVQAMFYFLTFFSTPWVETLVAIGSGLGLIAAFFFLMAPVTAVFAGLFLDQIAEKVERKHYPAQTPGTPLSATRAVLVALQFAVIVLFANILALPLVFTGFGIFVLLIINAYLISREYFEMAAMRHMGVADAKALRKDNASDIFMAGFIPAVLAIIPFVNLTVPLFATSYFVHIFKRVKASSA
jgi:CysZ protein